MLSGRGESSVTNLQDRAPAPVDRFWRDRNNVLFEIVEGDWDAPIRVREIVEDGSRPAPGVWTVGHFDPGGPIQMALHLTHPSAAWLAARVATNEQEIANAQELIARVGEAAKQGDKAISALFADKNADADTCNEQVARLQSFIADVQSGIDDDKERITLQAGRIHDLMSMAEMADAIAAKRA